ncbi:MAG: transglutaminase-like domain-containing protein [Microthrixaceae bacterium]
MQDIERFAELCLETAPLLDSGLAVIASVLSAHTSEAELLQGLDDAALEVSDRFQVASGRSITQASPAEFCQILFDRQGFRGDRAQYYNSSNSLLDRILVRRLAIPITLSILGIEVGRRCGFVFEGIGMPGHFLLAERENPRSFYDPFEGGRQLSVIQIREMFETLHGSHHRFDSSFLSPSEPRMILMRVLNNLRVAYERSGDRERLAQVARMQSVIPGFASQSLEFLARTLAADGRFLDAAEVHDRLCNENPAQAEYHQSAALRLRARLN